MRRLLLAAAFALLATSWASGENLVKNGGFEEGLTNWKWIEGDKADATCDVVSDVVHSGNSAVRITNKSKYPIYKRLMQSVPLKPNTKYKLTAWSKGKDMGWWGVMLKPVREKDWSRGAYLPSGHSGDRNYDWKQTVYEFTTDDKRPWWALQVNINDRIGELWLDDIQLEEVVEGKSAARGEAQLFTPTVLESLDEAGFYPALHEDLADAAPMLHVKPKHAGNPEFVFKITWSEEGVHFFVDVIDEIPGSVVKGGNMWQGDSVQIALDTQPDVRRRKLDERFHEVGYSVDTAGEIDRWSWSAAGKGGNALDWTGATEKGKITKDGWSVEALLPWEALGLLSDDLPEEIAVNILVNNADKGGRRTYTEWTGGIGSSKSPWLYNSMVMVSPDREVPGGFVSFDRQEIYSAEQTINGAYEDYAHVDARAGTLQLAAVRIEDGKAVQLGMAVLPAVKAGQGRRVPFSLPVGRIAEEGYWRIEAQVAGKTATSRIMVRQDLGLKVLEMLAAEKAHLEKVKAAASTANALKDAYVNAAVYVAERFFDRIENNPDMRKDKRIRPDSLDWQKLQLEEIEVVLDRTERIVERMAAGKSLPGLIGRPTGGPIEIKDSQFHTEVELPDGSKETRPFFFGGYLSNVQDFTPDYWAIGATLLQLPVGAHWASNKNFEAVRGYGRADTAHKKRMYVDFLNQLHGLPKGIAEENPGFLIKDLPSGFIKFFISHPAAKKYARTFTSTLARACKDRPGVFGICLENEPSYYVGGHDPDSRPLYTAFLAERHGTIDRLNKLYGTTHKDFASIDPPLPLGYRQPHVEFIPKEAQPGGGSPYEGSYRPDSIGQSRWYFDWCEFNTDYFMDWFEWLNGLVKEAAPDIPTNIKICEPLTRQRVLWGGRDDFERPTVLTDIAGNDSGSVYGDNELGFPAGYAFQWIQQGMLYDYQWSITGKPVYNSENHLIPTVPNRVIPIPMEDTRATLWHQALHHQAATTIWVWDLHFLGGALEGSIYVRPANMYGSAVAFFDLIRLMDKVAVVANAKPRVAILHTPVSLFWETDRSYDKTAIDAYIALTFTGEPVGFITPRMLAAGDYRDYKAIIVPNAVAVRQSTVDGLAQCAKTGVKIIAIGDDNLTRDEYWHERKLPAGLADMTVLKRQDGARLQVPGLRDELTKAGLKLTQPADARTGKPAWGVECRVVPHGDGKLVSMINLMPDALTVSLDLAGDATDLVTGDVKDLAGLSLSSMEYVLLSVKK